LAYLVVGLHVLLDLSVKYALKEAFRFYTFKIVRPDLKNESITDELCSLPKLFCSFQK